MFWKKNKTQSGYHAPEPPFLLPTPAPKVFEGEYSDLLNYLRWKCKCPMIDFDVQMIKMLARNGNEEESD